MTNKEKSLDFFRGYAKDKAINIAEDFTGGSPDVSMAYDSEMYIPPYIPRVFTEADAGKPFMRDGVIICLVPGKAHDATILPGGYDPASWRLWHTNDPSKAKPFAPQSGTLALYYKGNVYMEDDGTVWRCKREVGGTNYRVTEYPPDWEAVHV